MDEPANPDSARIGLTYRQLAGIGIVVGIVSVMISFALAGQDDTPLTWHGWLALSLAVGVVTLMTVGFAMLLNYNHRRGFDTAAQNIAAELDPVNPRRDPIKSD